MISSIILFVAIANIALGILIWVRNYRNPVNTYFGIFSILLGVWVGLNFFFQQTQDLLLIKIIYSFSLFIVIPAFLWIYYLVNKKSSKILSVIIIFLLIISSLISLLVLNTNYIVEYPIDRYNVKLGEFFFIYSSYVIILFLALIFQFFFAYKKSNASSRMKLRYVLLGFFFVIIIISLVSIILPSLGYTEFSVLDSPSSIIFVAFTAYAIIRHRLMDIRLIVVKSIIYTLLFITIGVVYTFFIFILGAFVFKDFTGREAYWAAMAVSLLVAFTFQPLKKVFTRWTDRVFFKGQYNFEELTSSLNEVATSTIILPELLFKFLDSLLEQMRLARGAFILLENNKVYETESIGYKQAINLEESELKHLVKEKKTEIFDEAEEGSKCKELMRKYNASLILPLETEGEVIGFLFLGEKKSGDIYSDKDIRVLEIITSQLALGVQNAKAYEKAQKFNLILRAEIARATKQLRDANQRLLDTDKAKDEFISLASHEIRTPIASLEGYLSMLNLQDLNKSQTSDITKRAYDDVNRLSNLVKDLLDVSRIEQRRMKISKTPSRVERLIQHAIDGFELQAQDKGLYIRFKKPEKLLPEINLDPDRISEVFNNLIGNAIKFTEKGGITISLEQKDKKALVSISDTGIGIPEKSIPRLFEKFYQAQAASSALSNERGGTGLGLYITKTIVEAHGGEVWVESKPRKGTTFFFTLPV